MDHRLLNKYLIIISFIGLLINPLTFSQTVAEEFNRGMDAYNKLLFADAYKIFEAVIQDYGIEDEIYVSARFYSANSILKMGKKDEAAAGFEFIVNNVVWSKFREESLFTLGLIYFDIKRYALCRKNHLLMIYQYPNSDYVGSAMYWIGESYAAEGKLDEAIDFLTQAIEDKSSNRFRDYALYALASVYEKMQDYQNAVKY